jgi:hypothetical protein
MIYIESVITNWPKEVFGSSGEEISIRRIGTCKETHSAGGN